MTIAAVDYGGNIDIDLWLSLSAFAQFAALETAGLATVNAANAATDIVRGFSQEAATAAAQLRRVRIAGVSLAIANATIALTDHRLGPTTGAGKIGPQTGVEYCAVPILAEAAAANDIFPVLITIGEA